MTTRLTRGMRYSILLTIVAVAAACGGGGSGGGTTPGTLPGTITGLTVQAMGGEGTTGDGGSGGDFYIEAYTGGDIKVLNTGPIDTSFVVPTVNPDLGPNPRTIMADTTLVPDGSYHILGDDGLTTATGLHVLPGYTLTLLGNRDTDGVPATMEEAQIEFDYGIIIQGTLTGYADEQVAGDGLSLDAIDIDFLADNLVLTETAVIDLHGKSALGAKVGGDGGDFDMRIRGTIISQAPIRAMGGDGDSGGEGGDVDLYTEDHGVYNTGTVDTSGGEGFNGIGGDAGYIDVHTHFGVQRHSGDLTARGGDGTLGGGGGDNIYLNVCDPGTILVECTLHTGGGNALLNGEGGDSGDIEFDLYQGPGSFAGMYVTRGGQAAGSGNGGHGGDISLDVYDYEIYDAERGYGVYFAASMDLRGGKGAMGGHAGDVDLYMDFDDGYSPDSTDHQGFMLVGYDWVDLSGGSGSNNGGDAGDYELEMEYGSNYDVEYIGSIVNEVAVIAVGGDGGAANGGDGGDFDLSTYDDETFHFDRSIVNTGKADLRGGDGPTGGGDGGGVWMYEYNHLENRADFNTTGGTAVSGLGGDGGYVELYGDDVIIHHGDVWTDGGPSTSGIGGDADDIEIYARQVTCTGALSCCGGASLNASGGAGGDMDIYGVATEIIIHGSCIVIGGSGVPDGPSGEVWLDGVNCDLTGGMVAIP